MAEPKFVSVYSMEDIERNFKDFDFFESVMSALVEALACEKEFSRKATKEIPKYQNSIPKVSI